MWLLDHSSAVATLIAGGVAYYLYIRQARDSKRDAANIILQEIQQAETRIRDLKTLVLAGRQQEIDQKMVLMAVPHWEKYGHLFIGNLTPHEWSCVVRFYADCEACDRAITAITKILPILLEERIRMVQRVTAYMAKDYAEEVVKSQRPENVSSRKGTKTAEELESAYSQRLEYFTTKFVDDEGFRYLYQPAKDYTALESVLEHVSSEISTSTIGLKLTKIAR